MHEALIKVGWSPCEVDVCFSMVNKDILLFMSYRLLYFFVWRHRMLPGVQRGIKGQAAAWWISDNSVDCQCSQQYLVREVLQKKQWLVFMSVKTIICHTAANPAHFLRWLWSCIWSVYLSKRATACYTLLSVVSYSMLCLNEFWGVITEWKSDCNF